MCGLKLSRSPENVSFSKKGTRWSAKTSADQLIDLAVEP